MHSTRKTAYKLLASFLAILSNTSGPVMAFNQHDFEEASERFGCTVFRSLAAEQKNQNIFVSPNSVSLIMAICTTGANGKTYEEMAETLTIPKDVARADLIEALRASIAQLKSTDSAVELDSANAIFLRSGIKLKPQFSEMLQSKFNCKSEAVDFNSPKTKEIICKWIADNTHGKIRSIEIHPGALTAAILLNALYFKGDWQYKFDPNNTRDGEFHNQSGNTVMLPMMHRQVQAAYMETENFQAINLPYGAGSYSAVIFVPKKIEEADALVDNMTGGNFEVWRDEFKQQSVSLTLPKFKIEYEAQLKDLLISMGMKSAFNSSAEFSEISPPGDSLSLSEVVHKTALEVDENGSTAAAVTAAQMKSRAIMMNRLEMTVDKPFVFSIYDNRQHSILFIGCMRNLH